MNYNELSIEEIKEIAKSRNISVGNSGKDKLIKKLEKYDIENETMSMISGTSTEDDIVPNDVCEENSISEPTAKDNIISEISNIVSDLDDFEESEEKDNTIEDIGMEEEVPCMSVAFGELVYVSPMTGAKYKWHKIGDVEYLTLKELVSMNNSKPVFLNRPWIILQDIRAVNKFRLMSKYEEVAKINQLKKLFATNDTNFIISTIDSAIKAGMRDVVISKVRTMYNNGVLNNTHIIKLLEERLKFDISTD